MVILTGIIFLVGCASTTKAPENLDSFSTNVRATFVTYKNMVRPHKAFAVAKYGQRDFSGYGYSYPTIEAAEKRALDECHQKAHQHNKSIKCFIYHSE